MKIRILPEAEKDLEIGATFYDAVRLGLGSHFLDCLFTDIENLCLLAGVHSKEHGYHCALSKRFPYLIFYDLNGEFVSVVAVLDARREPDLILANLQGR